MTKKAIIQLFLIIIISSCSATPPDPNKNPEAAAKLYIEALKKKDYDNILKYDSNYRVKLSNIVRQGYPDNIIKIKTEELRKAFTEKITDYYKETTLRKEHYIVKADNYKIEKVANHYSALANYLIYDVYVSLLFKNKNVTLASNKPPVKEMLMNMMISHSTIDGSLVHTFNDLIVISLEIVDEGTVYHTKEEKSSQVAVTPSSPEKPSSRTIEVQQSTPTSEPKPESPPMVHGKEPIPTEIKTSGAQPQGTPQKTVSPSRPPETQVRQETVSPSAQPSQSASAGPRWPWTSERLINDQDFQGLSRKDLELMRNEIYARHGWVFKRSDLRQYFGSQPWYRPKGDLSNQEQSNRLAQAELTPMEKKNIQAITSRENSLKK